MTYSPPHLWWKYGTDLQFYFLTVIFSWGKSLPAQSWSFYIWSNPRGKKKEQHEGNGRIQGKGRIQVKLRILVAKHRSRVVTGGGQGLPSIPGRSGWWNAGRAPRPMTRPQKSPRHTGFLWHWWDSPSGPGLSPLEWSHEQHDVHFSITAPWWVCDSFTHSFIQPVWTGCRL